MSAVRSSRPLHQLNDPDSFAAARRAFVDAALQALSRRSDLDFSVAEVVRDAGWHNAAFYRIFESKDRLLLAVAEEAVSRTVGRLEAKVRQASTAEDAMRAWATVLLRLAASEQAAASIEAFALERHRFLRRFPDSDQLLVAPVTDVLTHALEVFGISDAPLIADAAFELVMGRQATWIAQRHRPAPKEVQAWAGTVQRLVTCRPTSDD